MVLYLVNKEKNGSPALVWVYTFTNADYEAAKARGAVHIEHVGIRDVK